MITLQERVEDLCDAGRDGEARAWLRVLLEREPGAANVRFALRVFEPGADALPIVRLALLSTFTIDPLVPVLRALGLAHGLSIETRVSPYDQIEAELLDPEGALWAFAPDVLAIAADGEDLAPDLYAGYLGLSARAGGESLHEAVVARVDGWLAAARTHGDLPVLLHGLRPVAWPALGALDATRADGQRAAIARLDAAIAERARAYGSVFVVDIATLAARIGLERFSDSRLFHLARMRLAPQALPALARTYVTLLRAMRGLQRKLLVLDLDDTLWGGVLGEVGAAGISLGDTLPGSAHRDLQAAALELHERGVLLAIASKNEEADALAVLDTHPEMRIRRDHVAAWRIGWSDKASSIRELAEELGLSLEQTVFLDDNPAERAWVRSQLPEVAVPELPEEVTAWGPLLRSLRDFDGVTWTAEDRSRTRMYREEAGRRELRGRTATLEEFYAGLEMEAAIGPVRDSDIARVAQLTQRTNQFNLTTRRHDEASLRALRARPDAAVYGLRLRDRFGDSGLVGAAIVLREAGDAALDTFLLSCRVLGRTVESAFLAWIAGVERRAGARALRAWFRPTARNAPAADFLPKSGFMQQGDEWRLALDGELPAAPTWIAIREETDDVERDL